MREIGALARGWVKRTCSGCGNGNNYNAATAELTTSAVVAVAANKTTSSAAPAAA